MALCFVDGFDHYDVSGYKIWRCNFDLDNNVQIDNPFGSR